MYLTMIELVRTEIILAAAHWPLQVLKLLKPYAHNYRRLGAGGQVGGQLCVTSTALAIFKHVHIMDSMDRFKLKSK